MSSQRWLEYVPTFKARCVLNWGIRMFRHFPVNTALCYRVNQFSLASGIQKNSVIPGIGNHRCFPEEILWNVNRSHITNKTLQAV